MKNSKFETMDEFLARLPIEEQAEIMKGADKFAQDIRAHHARRFSDPLFVYSSLLRVDQEYVSIHWQVNIEKRLLMLHTPFPMPSHIQTIMDLIIQENEQFQKEGIHTSAELNSLFEIQLFQNLNEGKEWFEMRCNQSDDRS